MAASYVHPAVLIASSAPLGAMSTTTLAITATAFSSFNTPAITVPFPTGYGTKQTQLAYSWTGTATNGGQATSTIGGVAATSGIASVMAGYVAPTAGSSSSSSSSGFEWPTWATGVIVGCGVLALLVLVGALWCWRRRARRRRAAGMVPAKRGKKSKKGAAVLTEKDNESPTPRRKLNKAGHRKDEAAALAEFDSVPLDNNYPPYPTPPPIAAGTEYRSGSPYRPVANDSVYSLHNGSSGALPARGPSADPRYNVLAPAYNPSPYPIDPYGQPINPPSRHHRMASVDTADSGYETPNRTGPDVSSTSISGSPARLITNAAPMPTRGPGNYRWNDEPTDHDAGSAIGSAMLGGDRDELPPPVMPGEAIGQARGGSPVDEGGARGARAGRQEVEAPLLYPQGDVRNRRLAAAGAAVGHSGPPSPTLDVPAHYQGGAPTGRSESSQSHYHETRSGSSQSNRSGGSSERRRRKEAPPPVQAPTYDSGYGVPGSPAMDSPQGGWAQPPQGYERY
ncbi:hypothetical protein BCR35DRAFT_352251 [Leucosporidium creatinivorum]|uniref:Uncharacterized protein n=1 Tax=Leucosporidium creatinivorum TaxID=106004 RepID=A0A1Y2FEK5_9BASI|nr:hypothetical protein BCR35DRAFT_352251 [Leucosporidium creatinivorum]